MIKDLIANYKKYEDISSELKKGLEIIVNADFNSLPDGRHVYSDDIYMNIQTYVTKQDADYEAHRDYADIQYIISGEEKIGVTPYSLCSPKIPYNKDKDIEFLTGEGQYIPLREGEFMILLPKDAHKPSITLDNSCEVRKAVVKVRLR